MTVRNWRRYLVEKLQFITPDGKSLELYDPPKRGVFNLSGWGIPAPNIAVSQGPFQHGVTPLSVRYPPRVVEMTIRHNGCNRRDYWSIRRQIIDYMRLNRANVNLPVPGKLRRYLADGAVRDLDVMLSEGPGFQESSDVWDGWSVMEDLSFIAHNPVIYDPRQRVAGLGGGDLECTDQEQLTFPFVFAPGRGMLFGLEGVDCSAEALLSIAYEGNWEEFPRIIVTGPAEDIRIVHNQTGLILALDYTIAPNEQVTFDLTYGRKTLYNNFGVSLLNALTFDSNIGAFSIQPDPIVPGGLNTFTVSLTNGTGITATTIQYFNRYIGI